MCDYRLFKTHISVLLHLALCRRLELQKNMDAHCETKRKDLVFRQLHNETMGVTQNHFPDIWEIVMNIEITSA